MKIQSLSIHVPNKSCINKCKFCVSRMRTNQYEDLIQSSESKEFYEREYINRLNFARDNNCNTMMLTGTTEPQQNKNFIVHLMEMNKKLDRPFRNMELQTTGVLLDKKYLEFFKNQTEVKTISLSISNPFNDDNNAEIIGMPIKYRVNLIELSRLIKELGFNLRLSLNLTDVYNNLLNRNKKEELENIRAMLKYFKEEFMADQLTFRVFYTSPSDCEQNRWIEEHKADNRVKKTIEKYIADNGRKLDRLEYGAMRYSLDEMSTILDDDCMSKTDSENIRYLILRPNCKLYTKWDDKGSLLY